MKKVPKRPKYKQTKNPTSGLAVTQSGSGSGVIRLHFSLTGDDAHNFALLLSQLTPEGEILQKGEL
jgi:hypothetical protein